MRKSAIALALVCLAATSGTAFAYQTGKIYVSKEGEWMCIDKWGNEIPASSSGGWTVMNPPRAVGGECNNRFVIRLGNKYSFKPHDDFSVLEVQPVPGSKGINEAGIK